MAFEHEGVEIWYDFVTTLDCISYERSNLRIHPWLDNTANRIVVFVSLEAVNGKSWGIDAELDPAEK